MPPNLACAGQTVTISGSGFGATSQIARFPTVIGPLDSQVTSWSDTQIQVVTPVGVSCGDVQLVIGAGTVTGCGGQAVNVYKPGSGTPHFDGGTTQFRFDARVAPASPSTTRLRVDPGSTIEFSWSACPSNVSVRLTVTQTGVVIFDQTGLGADGHASVKSPVATVPTTLDCVLEVSGPCDPPVTRTIGVDVAPKPNVKVEGMEVTQGIQRFWRTGVTANSVPLVAGKETIVRVYVSTDMGGFNQDQVPNIVGVLSVGPLDLYPINGITPADPSGGHPLHTARNRTAILRENVDHTLNFRIPAGHCVGTKNLFCYLIVPGPGGKVDQTVGYSENCSWAPEPALQVRWVRIRDEHDPANVTPTTPTDAQALETARRAVDLLPYPPTDLSPAGIFAAHTTTRNFGEDAPGSAMCADIGNLRAAAETLGGQGTIPFDTEERWIGLTVPWFRGWGGWKVCVTPIYPAGATNGERLRAGHELGHTLGLCHMHDAACSGFTVEPTLGDVAFDPFLNRTIAATNHDFMSYTTWDDNWISAVNWDTLRTVL